MLSPIKSLAKRVFASCGLDVRRSMPHRHRWLQRGGIQTVLDIGASTGQFAVYIRRLLPEAMIYSVEPLHDCFAQLVSTMRHDKKFQAFNVALADYEGKASFQRSSVAEASSLLPMAEVHKDNFPSTAHHEPVEVTVTTLDSLSKKVVLCEPVLLKLDVQGAERIVLNGGLEVVRNAHCVVIEASFEELYVGQWLFDDVFHFLCSLGFRYVGGLDGYLVSPVDGRNLCEDAIFVKNDLSTRSSKPAKTIES